MNNEQRELVAYRRERAHESLEEAKILLENGHINTFVNRVYYACFYIVSSLLLTKELSSAKHSGVRSLFHQNYVRLGLVDVEMGHVYDKLFDNRQKGDYADLVRFESKDVDSWYDEAKEFVVVNGELIEKELVR